MEEKIIKILELVRMKENVQVREEYLVRYILQSRIA